mmetsp:Transcript_7167/g.15649  ORF Transcript_7167/g.15649 Transcript_7167/m.15649 type:complete len:298 (-) Transcript_7167:40-933(-)
MVTQRWLIIGLTVFALLLALANVGTSFAAATLAKDTEVTSTGELAVKGDADTTVATTAKGKTFALGPPLTGQEGERRRRRLGLLTSQSNILYDASWSIGHNSIGVHDVQALFLAYESGFVARVSWTCGHLGQGTRFSEDLRGATMTPYSQNVTDDVTHETTAVAGLLYELQVGGGITSRSSGVRGEEQRILIDCATASGESRQGGDTTVLTARDGLMVEGFEPVCTVSGTGCCMSWLNETTGESQDNCPEFKECNPCGCTCIDSGLDLSGSLCNSGCEVDGAPFNIAMQSAPDSGFV